MLSSAVTAGNPPPAAQWQSYQFRLHEHRSLGWQPAVTSAQLLAVLANLTALRIRGAYTAPGEGFLDSVELETALVGTQKYYLDRTNIFFFHAFQPGSGGEVARWVEQCECPVGYRGQHCDTCEPGYYTEQRAGKCVPCSCHGHSDYCHVDTGVCDCTHNTAGDT